MKKAVPNETLNTPQRVKLISFCGCIWKVAERKTLQEFLPMSTMFPPSRSGFLRTRLYRCALAYNKRNEQRLKHIRELLEKVEEKKRRQSGGKKRCVSSFVIPDDTDDRGKGRNNREDEAILAADKDKCDWTYDEDLEEYALTLGGVTVMKVPTDMYQRLKPFQRDAVKWIAGVAPTGGILADDMGMGKTFMTIASLGARMRCKRVRMALVVAPVSVLSGWADEAKRFLSKFIEHVRILKVHGGNNKDRMKTVRKAWKESSPDRPFLVISSWGLVTSAKTMNVFIPPSGHNWDYVFLDEAHLIKNQTSNRSKCCRKICHKAGTKRLLLTGVRIEFAANSLRFKFS